MTTVQTTQWTNRDAFFTSGRGRSGHGRGQTPAVSKRAGCGSIVTEP
jgi:hypothetical protein